MSDMVRQCQTWSDNVRHGQTMSDMVSHGLKHAEYTLRKEIRMKWTFTLTHKTLKSNLL